MEDRAIKVKGTTYQKLTKLAVYGDTMDDVITRLLDKKEKKEVAA
jgi:predicted CopG family antitoxin